MADLNTVTLSGRLTRDPESRMTTSGMTMVSFSIAVNRRKKRDQEEAEADFPRCIAFGSTADYMARYLHQGDSIGLIGRLQTRKYEDTDGKTVYVTEVIANEVTMLKAKGAADQNEKPKYDGGPRYGNSVHLEDFDTGDVKIDLGADDLPF